MKPTASTQCCATTADGDGGDPDPAAAEADNPPERPDPRPVVQVLRGSREAAAPPVDAAWLRKHLAAALRCIGRPVARVTVRVVGDEVMRELNRRFRRTGDTTDVLAFELSDPDEALEADIAVCAHEAARRAGDAAGRIERELLLYALHGVLHCAGFDDSTEEGFAAMHAEEDRILSAIGVGPTFARSLADRRAEGLVTEEDSGG